MGLPARRCSECGEPLGGDPRQLTCSPAHRQQRARRIKREQRERRDDRHETASPNSKDAVYAIIEGKTEDAIRAAFVEELRPVLREAIDEDAVRAVKGMVGLAPAAILVLQQDLASDDAVLRQRAAALVVKYTLGNPAAVPPREGQGAGLTIINQLPRPALPESGDLPSQATEDIEATADELRRCDTCRLDKPVGAFPADGPRCQQCLDEKKALVLERYDGGDALREPPTAAPLQRPGGPGGSQVHQARPGVQPGQLWATRVDQGWDPNQPRPQAFGGPPDPRRFSNGE